MLREIISKKVYFDESHKNKHSIDHITHIKVIVEYVVVRSIKTNSMLFG